MPESAPTCIAVEPLAPVIRGVRLSHLKPNSECLIAGKTTKRNVSGFANPGEPSLCLLLTSLAEQTPQYSPGGCTWSSSLGFTWVPSRSFGDRSAKQHGTSSTGCNALHCVSPGNVCLSGLVLLPCEGATSKRHKTSEVVVALAQEGCYRFLSASRDSFHVRRAGSATARGLARSAAVGRPPAVRGSSSG